jgi:iron complex outermembrane receptor protein
MTIHATDKLRLIAGGRYTDDILSLQMQNDTATAIESTTRLHVGKVSWKAGIQYDIDPRTMAYATVARGFKGGQIATPSDANPYVVLPKSRPRMNWASRPRCCAVGCSMPTCSTRRSKTSRRNNAR